MQWDRTADLAALSGSVRGLGVSDALRLELVPLQHARLAEQLEALDVEVEARVTAHQRAVRSPRDEAVDAVGAARYERHLVQLMRAGLEACDTRAPFAFAGPTGMVLELVRACLTGVVAELAQHLAGEAADGSQDALDQKMEATAAWLRTFADCRAVERFRFDAEGEPARAG
jgi:hypothetical protein